MSIAWMKLLWAPVHPPGARRGIGYAAVTEEGFPALLTLGMEKRWGKP